MRGWVLVRKEKFISLRESKQVSFELARALMELMEMHLIHSSDTPICSQDWHARDCRWKKPDGEFCSPSCRQSRNALSRWKGSVNHGHQG